MFKFKSVVLITLLIGSLSVVNPTINASAEDLFVPKASFPKCDDTRQTYCVESVSVKALGATEENLSFTPSGTQLERGPASNPPEVTLFPGQTALSGTWSSSSWETNGHATYGYDGLFIDVKAANQWSNFLSVNVRPVLVDSNNLAKNAVTTAGGTAAASLNLNEDVIIKIRSGMFKSGTSIGISTSYTTVQSSDSNGNTLTISARPVEVSVASSSNKCKGESGVADYKANQILITYAPTNDPNGGFGVDGMSGNMAVATNGACLVSTPVWNSTTSQLVWSVAAPHFAPDGKTLNKGFYKAVIPAIDAGLLWGLLDINVANKALVVSVTDDNGEPATAISSISIKGDKIVIEATGFQYSKPTIKIAKNKKFKGFATKKTLRCTKNGALIVYKGFTCPAGFKVKK